MGHVTFYAYLERGAGAGESPGASRMISRDKAIGNVGSGLFPEVNGA